MIDWGMVASNSLWILGLSVLLAAFSYHDWLAGKTGQRRRDLFTKRSFLLPCTLGLFLTCAGWGIGQAVRWWEKAIWFVLAATFGWGMLRLLAEAYRQSKTDTPGPQSK